MVSTFSLNLIFCCLSIQSITCFITSESIGFTLPLIPRFSPESPFYPGNLTFEEKVEKAVELSMLRAHYIDLMSSHGSISSNNIRLIVRPVIYHYATKIELGTPKSTQFLVVDTASTLLWTQCQPCVNCYNQTISIFDPNQSTTYSKIPCEDPVCQRCTDGQCKYKLSYADGSGTEGFLSTETFTFESNKGHPTPVKRIVFGCGYDNKGFKFDHHYISGILGLDNGRGSLISQMFQYIKGRFSYCLVHSARKGTGESSLRFGDDAVLKTKHGVQTINIVDSVENYFVNLIDVSVANKRMRFPPGTFARKSDGKGGCTFDTGSPATLFPQGPYDVLMKEFDKYFKSHHLERVYNVSEGLKYCYKSNSSFRAYASMTLHFQNADYVVVSDSQYIHLKDKGCFCVAVLVHPGQSQRTLIGAWQQQDMRFLYDLKEKIIRFVPETCAADH